MSLNKISKKKWGLISNKIFSSKNFRFLRIFFDFLFYFEMNFWQNAPDLTRILFFTFSISFCKSVTVVARINLLTQNVCLFFSCAEIEKFSTNRKKNWRYFKSCVFFSKNENLKIYLCFFHILGVGLWKKIGRIFFRNLPICIDDVFEKKREKMCALARMWDLPPSPLLFKISYHNRDLQRFKNPSKSAVVSGFYELNRCGFFLRIAKLAQLADVRWSGTTRILWFEILLISRNFGYNFSETIYRTVLYMVCG